MESALIECDAQCAVDLVIANAGIGGAAVLAPNTGESGDIARQIFSVNTLGVLNRWHRCCHASLPAAADRSSL
jgi:hypothetical protein